MTRTTRRLVVAAVGLMLLGQGAAVAAGPPVLTKPVHVTKEDVNPVRTYSAPNLLAHPKDPLVVVGAFADLRTRRCGLVRTVDGGVTWKILESSPSPASYPSCNSNPRGSFQGLLAYGRDDALYYALDGWDTQDGGIGGNVSMIVSRSTDLGDTWQPVVARDARGKTGQEQESYRPITGFAVDSRTGSQDKVYVGSGRRQPGFSGPNALPVQPVIAASVDGGKTFGEPVNLAESAFSDPATRQKAFQSATTTVPTGPTTTTTTPPAGSRAATPDQAANFGGFGPAVTVDDKGRVYAMWPATYANLNPRPANAVFLSRSEDQGKTWTTSAVTPFSSSIGSFSNLAWSPEGGPEGTLHAVADGYEANVSGYQDIYYYRSTDVGRTWSERRNVTDDDPKQYFGQFYPNIAVAPGGRIEIAFWDSRTDPGYRANDVYMTTSVDNGATWSPNIRVTDQPIDRRIGVWSTNFDITSPPGLAPAKAYTMLAWDDTRNTDRSSPDATALGGGLQDIYVSAVQYEEIAGGTSRAAKLALAGVVGLLIVGLALFGFSMLSRRSGGGPAPSTDRVPPARAKVG